MRCPGLADLLLVWICIRIITTWYILRPICTLLNILQLWTDQNSRGQSTFVNALTRQNLSKKNTLGFWRPLILTHTTFSVQMSFDTLRLHITEGITWILIWYGHLLSCYSLAND